MITDEQYKRLDWILTKCQSCDSLTDWETDFVDDLTDRLERWEHHLNVTDRMWEILERLSEKAGVG